MSETVEHILARAKGNIETNSQIQEFKPITKSGEVKKLDYVEHENKKFAEQRANKKATLKMIDILYPISNNPVGNLISDREFAELFAEITQYDYDRCKRIFTSAILMKELLDITYPKLLIYKGIMHGKMGV